MPSRRGMGKQLWCIHTMENHSAVTRDEPASHTKLWVTHRCISLEERSQSADIAYDPMYGIFWERHNAENDEGISVSRGKEEAGGPPEEAQGVFVHNEASHPVHL